MQIQIDYDKENDKCMCCALRLALQQSKVGTHGEYALGIFLKRMLIQHTQQDAHEYLTYMLKITKDDCEINHSDLLKSYISITEGKIILKRQCEICDESWLHEEVIPVT